MFKSVLLASGVWVLSLFYVSLWVYHAPVAAQAPQLSSSQPVPCEVVALPITAADPLAQLLRLQEPCPENVQQFRQMLMQQGLTLQTTLVANRGFHNPDAGSFSLFEMVSGTVAGQVLTPGSFFFGHFTEAKAQTLQHQQNPRQGALMIELIVWDALAEVFRFYEMIGNGQNGQWFYRGDSLDIREDLRTLHLQSNPDQPQFGNRLRCSACHLAGGPIMKELAPPHNDWWQASRPLPWVQNPDPALAANLETLVDASHLAVAVQAGLQKLENSAAFQNQMRSLPEQLRPLFCAEEVNLASDFAPLDTATLTHLPTETLLDPRLLPPDYLSFSTVAYRQALQTLQARFPETQRADADHAWLAPVKSDADRQAVRQWIQQGLISEELVGDVLAIDPLRPVVSAQRCALLKTLPLQATPDWQVQWQTRLAQSSLPGAATLYQHLTDPSYNLAYHRQKALNTLACVKTQPVAEILNWIGLQRQAVFESELAKHPRGQIFEPGFRVIFPALHLSPSSSLLRCQN